MTFSLHVEHEVIGGEMVLETFDGIESFNDPPMTNTLHLKFSESNKDDKKLKHGSVVRAVDTTKND